MNHSVIHEIGKIGTGERFKIVVRPEKSIDVRRIVVNVPCFSMFFLSCKTLEIEKMDCGLLSPWFGEGGNAIRFGFCLAKGEEYAFDVEYTGLSPAPYVAGSSYNFNVVFAGVER